jgi:hypothetical protein
VLFVSQRHKLKPVRPDILLEAVEKAGVRALISAGWSQMGGVDVPRDVFILGR